MLLELLEQQSALFHAALFYKQTETVLENHDDVVVKQAKAKVKYEIQTFTS
jgi:hypothetical protein